MATYYCILAWEIPWTEEPGGLQSVGSQRFVHDIATNNSMIMEETGKNITIFSQKGKHHKFLSIVG